MNPYLFIVGCARSGTTLLHRLVDAHPLVAIIHETHWITKRFKEPAVTPEMVSEMVEHKRFASLGVGREEFEDLLGEPVSYRRFLGGLFELYAEARSKPLVGDKTPSYVTSIPKLHALWPEARFVHIVRDGRDVCLSVMNWKKRAALPAATPPGRRTRLHHRPLVGEEGAPGPQRRRLASGGALSRSSLRRPNKPSRARVRQAL